MTRRLLARGRVRPWDLATCMVRRMRGLRSRAVQSARAWGRRVAVLLKAHRWAATWAGWRRQGRAWELWGLIPVPWAGCRWVRITPERWAGCPWAVMVAGSEERRRWEDSAVGCLWEVWAAVSTA